jgi:hypothetical protein
MAATCAHCDCRILGHGVEAEDTIDCCARCAKHAGAEEIADRA